MQSIAAHIYDFPRYYDLIFGSDWKAEFDFILACCQRHAQRPVRRFFEPACGTGRLLVKLAQAGYRVAGNDLNPQAVKFCNARLRKYGFQPTAVVGDMADFTLPRPVDAAFNTINSFRHLQSEEQAHAHLECMAAAIAPGGLYLLGLHLTPRGRSQCTEEAWSARRGHLQVNSRMWSQKVDRVRRKERVGMTFDVYTPTKQFRIEEEFDFRTYTLDQWTSLLAASPAWEVVATYDFAYDLDVPIEVGPETEDVVYVLRRKKSGQQARPARRPR